MSVRKAFVISLSDKYASILIQLVGSMIVARLLTPAEFGVFSLAMSVSILAQVFRDLGVGQYLIQEKSLTTEKIRAAQTILITASLTLGTAVILSAEAAAAFYQEPKIIPLLWMLGANFFLLPVGAVTFALWRRNLQFGRIAIIAILATLINTLTTIVLAYKGYSYLSLGWGTLAGSLVTAGLCLAMKPEGVPYLPGLRGIKRVLHYSSLATLNSLLETLNDRAPTLILGKTEGMEVVGIYERAMTLALLFNQLLMNAIWSIATPLLAQKIRSGHNIESDYIKSVSLITALGFGFMTWVAIAADPLILILFGDQWGAAVPLVQLICLLKMIGMPNNISSSLIIGHGNIQMHTRVTLVSKGGSIAGAIWGSQWGVEGVLIGLIINIAIANCWIFFCIRRYVSIIKIIRESFFSLMLAVTLGASMQLTLALFTEQTLIAWFVASSVGAITWLISLYTTSHPLAIEAKRTAIDHFRKIA
ncbi:MAG: lipopolysaccharide biosynthesis protein [Motiliproteus sp.]